jgi:DegV family protein with EDD domain
MIEIVTDSTCDIPEPIAQSYKVTVIPAHLNIGQETYRDGVDISRQEFYQRLARERDLPRTSSPSPGAFIEVYRHLLGEAQYIVSVHVASTLSGIYNTARLAAEQLAPERILDTLERVRAGGGGGGPIG